MKNKLDKIAKKYPETEGFEKIITDYKIKEILSYSVGDTILDLGCGVGLITEELAKKHKKVVGVDGSPDKLNEAKGRISNKNIVFIESYFEDYNPNFLFDTVVISNVLEHLPDPVSTLKHVKSWLSKEGRVVATVPNAWSLNRKLGMAMGVIKDQYELTKDDIGKGHLRVYDKNSLRNDFKKAGYKIIYLGGVFFKPFPHKIMEKIHTTELDEALFKLRKEYSDLCSALIIVATKE